MKTKILLITAVLFFGIKSFGQTTANLDLNNISAPINSNGDLFWDHVSAGFEAPKGSGLHTIFAANLWIAGYDQGGQLHAAAQTYRQTGSDFFQGPMMDNWNYSSSTDAQWNKVWKIRKTTIDSFRLGLFGNNIPQIILNWPGNGNVSLGEMQTLAPFFDLNNDNIYDPAAGDYPKINGDMAVFFIFNDDRNSHTESGGQKLGVEMHGMAYVFICGNDAIDNTIFLHYDIFNRSANSYHNVYAGMWTDFDLGLYSDDMIACDVTRNCYYAYNGVASDGNGGPGTYGLSPPAQAVVFLNGIEADSADGVDNNKNCTVDEPGESNLMSKFVYYDNDATLQGNPNVAQDYYNYMNGKWRDGTNVTYGGTGYNTGSPCSYMFPGNSDQNYGWGLGGDCTAPVIGTAIWDCQNSGDVRGLGSSGPFTMKAGGVYTLDLAYVFGRDVNSNNLTNINIMDQRIDVIRNCFNYNITPCGGPFFNTGVAEDHADQNAISIYPNPASDILFISLSRKTINAVAEIYDATGMKIKEIGKEQLAVGNISVSEFAKGLYFIRIIDGDKMYSKKFIKE